MSSSNRLIGLTREIKVDQLPIKIGWRDVHIAFWDFSRTNFPKHFLQKSIFSIALHQNLTRL